LHYRADWLVWLRANNLIIAQRVFDRLRKVLPEEVTTTTFVPQHSQRGMWECRFSTGEWEMPFAEAVVKCMALAGLVAKPYEWHYEFEDGQFTGYFRKGSPDYPGTWLTGLEWADFTLRDVSEPVEPPNIVHEDMYGISGEYTIGIQAEMRNEWQPPVDPADARTNVSVTFASGAKWIATFVTFQHVETLRRKFQEDGECLRGRYLHINDMILVEDVSRECIEAVIRHLLSNREFERAFRLEWSDVRGCNDDVEECADDVE